MLVITICYDGPMVIKLTPREAALLRDAFVQGEPYLTDAEPLIERIGKEADDFFIAKKKAIYRDRTTNDA